ncbi:PIN domain nuclease [Caulobacter sp. D4A]|uniref:type II toxin-antitoxin system VapC family toxin n=1 Tax=unclassified Caulobacter TaxID=2648921 RepID=UPI000D728F26|nr:MULTISPECIES: type II toxin-antitoxin system VapC family toxin [unclassified Caulobacter]PXA89805.1 PIN domain nuclease [Caulobacter sp. D4A]PXA92553.1 PIN domain nuclease [Caulobacter sp. D5]
MKLLIDTHVLIWWWTDVDRLSPSARGFLGDIDVKIYVSAVSAYEIEFKRRRDPLLQRLPADLLTAATAAGFLWRDVNPADAVVAGRLPTHHRDPWDRLIVAQAINDKAPILSIDGALGAYDVPIHW